MDKKRSILNIFVSMSSKIITVIFVIVVKRFLIQICGNDVNGLNSLYLSIIGFLSVAELGIGSAITFCMYKPIVDGDNIAVSALYQLFHKIYRIVGVIILTVGFAITPFVKFFAKDYSQLDVNFYLTFVLMLLSVVITYLFGAKTALINAYKNNYITTAITSGGVILQYILQIVVLVFTGSFSWYLFCRIVSSVAQWVATEYFARKDYRNIISNKQKVDKDTKSKLIVSIKAMFMHKIGGLLVNTVDSIVISVFIGVVALGEYSNYSAILVSLTNILALAFTSLTSILGHLYVEHSKTTTKKYSEAFHLLNFALGTVFYLGYYAIIDNLIAILFSADLVVSRSISFVITLNGFVQFMRRSVLAFRDATGVFCNDQWKPILEGTVNIILSVILVKYIGVVGVIVATIITNLLICHIVEPYVLYKNAFVESPKRYYFTNYSMIILFFASLIVLDCCLQNFTSEWLELLVNGMISVAISVVLCIPTILRNRDVCVAIFSKFKRNR